MRVKEYYYILEFYQISGFDPFSRHVNEYLAGQRTIPVTRTTSTLHGYYVSYTFSNPLMYAFSRDTRSMKKPYEIALTYGFRGYSQGGKNGIFYIRKTDKGLLKAMPGLIETHANAIQDDLVIEKKEFASLLNVKIVWHNPSGERIVGVYNQANHRIIFLDFAHY
jgi:hypothetical protein